MRAEKTEINQVVKQYKQYKEWTSCHTINIDVCLNILVAAQHCVIWMYCHLFSQFLIGWIFRVCVVGCVLIS